MTCGRVSTLSQRKTFEDLAVRVRGQFCQRSRESIPAGCGEADRPAGGGRCASCDPAQTEIQNQPEKKTAAAVYEYQADCDGEWGEIQFDFENGSAETVALPIGIRR